MMPSSPAREGTGIDITSRCVLQADSLMNGLLCHVSALQACTDMNSYRPPKQASQLARVQRRPLEAASQLLGPHVLYWKVTLACSVIDAISLM